MIDTQFGELEPATRERSVIVPVEVTTLRRIHASVWEAINEAIAQDIPFSPIFVN